MCGKTGSAACALLLALVLVIVLLPNLAYQVHAPAALQPSAFFFHTQRNQTLNTINAILWANTTQRWSAVMQNESRTAVGGSPAIWQFYSQPAMAGNVTISDLFNFTVYLDASQNTGGGTIINGTLSKIRSSGASNVLGVASFNTQVLTRVAPFSLNSTVGPFQLEAGVILELIVTVSITGGTPRTITLHYDSPSTPSRVLISFQSRLGIASFSTYNETGIQTVFFGRNATSHLLSLQAVVYDALGLYDVVTPKLNITSPGGPPYLTDTPMTRTAGSDQSYVGTWSLNITYLSNDQSGAYTSNLRVLDNGGLIITTQLSYIIYAMWRLNIQTLSMDQPSVSVPGVAVSIFMDGNPVYFGISNASGWVIPAQLIVQDNETYTISAYWQGLPVNQPTILNPDTSANLTLPLSVYLTDFSRAFRDGDGNPLTLQPSSFQLYSPNGSITIPDPSRPYLLPAGTYTISSVVWQGVDVTPPAASFNPRDGTPAFNLQIYDLTVSFVDQNGGIVSGLKVTLSLSGRVVSQGYADSGGVLVFRKLPRGEYTILAQVDQHSTPVKTVLSLTKDSSTTVQVPTPNAISPVVNESLVWILIAAAIMASFLVYRLVDRSMHKKKSSSTARSQKQTSGSQRFRT